MVLDIAAVAGQRTGPKVDLAMLFYPFLKVILDRGLGPGRRHRYIGGIQQLLAHLGFMLKRLLLRQETALHIALRTIGIGILDVDIIDGPWSSRRNTI